MAYPPCEFSLRGHAMSQFNTFLAPSPAGLCLSPITWASIGPRRCSRKRPTRAGKAPIDASVVSIVNPGHPVYCPARASRRREDSAGAASLPSARRREDRDQAFPVSIRSRNMSAQGDTSALQRGISHRISIRLLPCGPGHV